MSLALDFDSCGLGRSSTVQPHVRPDVVVENLHPADSLASAREKYVEPDGCNHESDQCVVELGRDSVEDLGQASETKQQEDQQRQDRGNGEHDSGVKSKAQTDGDCQ